MNKINLKKVAESLLWFIIITLIFTIIVNLTGCEESKEAELKRTIINLEREQERLLTSIAEAQVEEYTIHERIKNLRSQYHLKDYYIRFELSQSHLTLDLGQHLKDAMNTIEFDLPVSKEFYESVKVDQKIVDEFRMGSFIMNGSFGDWEMKIIKKYIKG